MTLAADVNFQVYLLDGIHRWNQDRQREAVKASTIAQRQLMHRKSSQSCFYDIFSSEGLVVSIFRQTLRLTTLKIYY